MVHPIMPKATAVWLVEYTALSFTQIGAFCGLHQLEVQAIADEDVSIGMQGMDPIASGELTREEIDRCSADPAAEMKQAKPSIQVRPKQKGARYTPLSKRQDRPDAIAWLLKNYAELSDAQISRLIGTTKPTINAIRDKSHWNTPNIKPQNPVNLGLCSGQGLEKVVSKARAAKEKEAREAERKAAKAAKAKAAQTEIAGDTTAKGEAAEAAPTATEESGADATAQEDGAAAGTPGAGEAGGETVETASTPTDEGGTDASAQATEAESAPETTRD
jgi:hypothetical protein